MTTQLSLPFNLQERPQFKEYIKQHWNVTFAFQKKISVCAKRIMTRTLTQIKDNDFELKPYFQMLVTDVISAESYKDKRSAYKEVKKAFQELAQQVWDFEDLDNQRYVPRNILDTTKTKSKHGFESSYDKGVITIVLNEALAPYFINLAHYTIYEANEEYMTFTSWYSMRLFELLAAFKDTGKWIVPIDEFRRLMDCKNKYPQLADLLKYTLAEPLKELESTDYAFTYKTNFNATKRGRPSIESLEFRLKKIQLKEIPTPWYRGLAQDQKDLVDRLRSYKVSEANIMKYIVPIGVKKIMALLKEWDMKERSERRIDDKKKYCNKVWVTVGKQVVENLKTKA